MRLWIDGKSNVLSDAGSRAPWETTLARRLPLPLQPVLDTIRDMFERPQVLAQKVEKRKNDLGLGEWEPIGDLPLSDIQRVPLAPAPPPVVRHKRTSYQADTVDDLGEPIEDTQDGPRNSPLAIPSLPASSTRSTTSAELDQTIPPYTRKDYCLGYPTLPAVLENATTTDGQTTTFTSGYDVPVPSDSMSLSDIRSHEEYYIGTDSEFESYYTGQDEPASTNHSRLASEAFGNDQSSKRLRPITPRGQQRAAAPFTFQSDWKRRRVNRVSVIQASSAHRIDFLEISDAPGPLSSAARAQGLSVADAVDLRLGPPLSTAKGFTRVQRLIDEQRPFLTYLGLYRDSGHAASLADYVRGLGLFVVLDVPSSLRPKQLEAMLQISRFGNMTSLEVHGCMYGLRHSGSQHLAFYVYAFYTNALFLTPLAKPCTPELEHDHDIEPFTANDAKLYPRALCHEYMQLVLSGLDTAREEHYRGQPVEVSTDFSVIHPGRVCGCYPSAPLCYLNAEMRDAVVDAIEANAQTRSTNNLPQVAANTDDTAAASSDAPGELVLAATGAGRTPREMPIGGAAVALPVFGSDLKDLGLSQRDHAEYETLCRQLCDQGIPVSKIIHGTNASGREEFVLHFDQSVFSARSMRDVKSLRVPCQMSHDRPGLGHDVAACITHLLYMASRQEVESGRCGVGVLKPNGFHGLDNDLFYVHEPDQAVRDWWEPRIDTFVPARVFCTNNSFVRYTRTGNKQYKCHGHPLETDHLLVDDPLHYADGTKLATRTRAEDFLRKIRVSVQRVGEQLRLTATSPMTGVRFGMFVDGCQTPANPTTLEACRLLTRYHWSLTHEPLTGILVFFQLRDFTRNNTHPKSKVVFAAFDYLTLQPAEYQFTRRDNKSPPTTSKMLDPIALDPLDRIDFEHPVVFIVFVCDPDHDLKDHRDSLESYGFTLPNSAKVLSFDHALSSLGIERQRYLELCRTSRDTRALCALLWWFSNDALEYTTVRTVEPEDPPDDDLPALVDDEGDGVSPDPEVEIPEEPSGAFDASVKELVQAGAGSSLDAPPAAAPAPLAASNLPQLVVNGSEFSISVAHLPELAKTSGIPVAELKTATVYLRDHRFFYGLLQRRCYNRQTGIFEWRTCIPDGGWKSVQFQGQTRRYSLRKFLILLHHDNPLGGHRDRDHTYDALTDSGNYWKSMRVDIDHHVRACIICRHAQGRTIVTGLMRSREAEGPFRVLVIDFVGPQRPVTPRGNLYLFTCACVYSGWYWAIPTAADDGITAARTFAERVMFDLAGVPVVLMSDRALAFTQGVIKHLNETFGVERVLGSSLHPQSQSAVERPHRTYKALGLKFMQDFDRDWDLVAALFQWTVRTNCKVYNGSFTPYEIITGL